MIVAEAEDSRRCQCQLRSLPLLSPSSGPARFTVSSPFVLQPASVTLCAHSALPLGTQCHTHFAQHPLSSANRPPPSSARTFFSLPVVGCVCCWLLLLQATRSAPQRGAARASHARTHTRRAGPLPACRAVGAVRSAVSSGKQGSPSVSFPPLCVLLLSPPMASGCGPIRAPRRGCAKYCCTAQPASLPNRPMEIPSPPLHDALDTLAMDREERDTTDRASRAVV